MKRVLRKVWKIALKMAIWFFAVTIFFVILFRWVQVPGTPLMMIRTVEQKRDSKPVKIKKSWKSLDNISPHLQLAVVCSEDQNFLKHHGFDLGAIKKAKAHNDKGKRKRGASTISQQVAKNLFLWPKRSWIRKGFEVYFTALIEVFWSKQRIMEVYLNIAEMGDGIYGAEAAAQHYFSKPAANLTKAEAAALAVILPSPRKYNPARPGLYVQGRIAWAQQQMRFWGGKLDYDKEKKRKQENKKKGK